VIFPDFNPVALQLGPVAVRWYALAYVAGILLGWRYAVALVKNPRIWRGLAPTADEKQVDDYVLWVAIGVVGGGRLGSILFYDTKVIWTDPVEILKPWHGGMSFHGGLIGVIVAILLFARANRINVWRLADITAPCVPIGLFFGRIANFINGELWGRVTHVPWAMVFCNARIQRTYGGCPAGLLPRHPSQLYEAGLEGVALFLLLRWATHGRKLLPRRGMVTGLFLLGYGCARIALENVRQPDLDMPVFPFGLTMGIMLSVPMVLAGLALIAWAARPDALAAGVQPADGGVDALESPHDPMQSLAADASEAGAGQTDGV
jgi:phosphatidylglycerol---prolipoprotein diacylglyceryl transferase